MYRHSVEMPRKPVSPQRGKFTGFISIERRFLTFDRAHFVEQVSTRISPNQKTAVWSKLHAYFVNLMQNIDKIDHLKCIYNNRGKLTISLYIMYTIYRLGNATSPCERYEQNYARSRLLVQTFHETIFHVWSRLRWKTISMSTWLVRIF